MSLGSSFKPCFLTAKHVITNALEKFSSGKELCEELDSSLMRAKTEVFKEVSFNVSTSAPFDLISRVNLTSTKLCKIDKIYWDTDYDIAIVFPSSDSIRTLGCEWMSCKFEEKTLFGRVPKISCRKDGLATRVTEGVRESQTVDYEFKIEPPMFAVHGDSGSFVMHGEECVGMVIREECTTECKEGYSFIEKEKPVRNLFFMPRSEDKVTKETMKNKERVRTITVTQKNVSVVCLHSSAITDFLSRVVDCEGVYTV